MKEVAEEMYRDWHILIQAEQNMCANFSFAITDPSGHRQKVTMGGDNEQRALERARELIDMEIDFAAEE